MTGGVLGNAFDFLVNTGFLNTLVPFLLFYSIVFGMLERTQIFTPKHKKDKPDEQITNLHALIAFAIAITSTAAAQAVGITQNYLPILAVASVILLGIMMLLGMAFGDKFDEIIKTNKMYTSIIWFTAIILVVGALVVVTYYSGLVVTPCEAGKNLRPVNTLNVNEGECTKLMDFSGFPTTAYVMGMDTSTLLNNETLGWAVGIGFLVALILIPIAITKKST